MLSLFTRIDGISMLQIELLVLAFAIACTCLLGAHCPICSWLEWVAPMAEDDNPEE
jgi:hypothetical protein